VSGYDVAIVLIAFNRPDHVARVFDVVRRVRPATLFLVADGPRADHPDDVGRCRAVRAIIDRVDWPCEVQRDFSDENLGCDPRVISGLNWVFSQVDRAVVLEDDVVPDASFFPWCAAMLDRYGDVDEVTQVSGRNELGQWGPPGADHLLARRGSIYGWATWAASWSRADLDLADAIHPDTPARLRALDLDPLLHAQLMLHLAAAAAGHLDPWDWRWTAARILADQWAVVPSVNLVHNCGFGPDATHTVNAEHITSSVPVGTAPTLDPDAGRPPPDEQYDGASLLVEIMGTYREPAMVARLARSRRLFENSDGQVEHFLAPFDRLDESLAVLSHLRAVGTVSDTLDRVERALLFEYERARG